MAEREGKILGYALTSRVDDLLILDNISTQPEAKGLGSKLMAEVMKAAADTGIKTVALTTFRSPPWNGPWFRRFGFLPISHAEIGPELAKIIERQATYLDPRQRETLSRRVSTADE